MRLTVLAVLVALPASAAEGNLLAKKLPMLVRPCTMTSQRLRAMSAAWAGDVTIA